jgi:hypothetical protein
MAAAVKEAPKKRAPGPRRGVSLGLVGLLFMFMTPVGLAVAWWHPLFRRGNKRDRLLVLIVIGYLALFVSLFVIALLEE